MVVRVFDKKNRGCKIEDVDNISYYNSLGLLVVEQGDSYQKIQLFNTDVADENDYVYFEVSNN